MSCKTCNFFQERKIPSNNTVSYTTIYFCTEESNFGKIVQPEDMICGLYQDKIFSGGIVTQVANQTNPKCKWLNKYNDCWANETAGVHNPDCDGCTLFEESDYDPVSRPDHYAAGRKYEPKDVIRDWNLNFNLGSAVKYISRAGRKDDIIQDLKKAQQFLQFEIDYLEGKK